MRIKINGLRKAVQKYNEDSPLYRIIMLNMEDGRLWTNEYASENQWTDYKNPNIICLTRILREMGLSATEKNVKMVAQRMVDEFWGHD